MARGKGFAFELNQIARANHTPDHRAISIRNMPGNATNLEIAKRNLTGGHRGHGEMPRGSWEGEQLHPPGVAVFPNIQFSMSSPVFPVLPVVPIHFTARAGVRRIVQLACPASPCWLRVTRSKRLNSAMTFSRVCLASFSGMRLRICARQQLLQEFGQFRALTGATAAIPSARRSWRPER